MLSKAQSYSDMMLTQCRFMQSFVDDLLDLKEMREGTFSLVKQIFDPKETFEMVMDIFSPQANAEQLKMSFNVSENLRRP